MPGPATSTSSQGAASESLPVGPLRASRARLLAIPYAVFFLVLFGIEAAVRLTQPHLSSLDLFVTAPEQQAQLADAHHVRIFEGDPLLFWRLQPDLQDVLWEMTPVTTNAQGLRYPSPVGRKPADAFRIVCLGDSVTFGFRAPIVFARRPQDTSADWIAYPVRLERSLRVANPGRRVEVIPLAVPGYSTHQGLAWLRRDIGRLQPDVVTACFGWNDIGLRARADAEAMPVDGVSVFARTLLARSQALAHTWRFVQSRRANTRDQAAASVCRVPPEAYAANLIEIARLADAHGAAVLLIAPVYRDRVSYPEEAVRIGRLRAALRAAAAHEGLALLEIPELTEAGDPGNADLFLEHIHPNHRGHRLMADRILAALAERRMLGGLAASAPSVPIVP